MAVVLISDTRYPYNPRTFVARKERFYQLIAPWQFLGFDQLFATIGLLLGLENTSMANMKLVFVIPVEDPDGRIEAVRIAKRLINSGIVPPESIEIFQQNAKDLNEWTPVPLEEK